LQDLLKRLMGLEPATFCMAIVCAVRVNARFCGDSGDAVSKEYKPPFSLVGGRIVKVEVQVGDDGYLDTERDFAAAMARD
jgi:hypothetical protein